MSRSGYSDDVDPLELGRWRGRVASAIRGKRGQAFLRELLAALDAMPEKRLVSNSFQRSDGCVCALGAVAKVRNIDTARLEPADEDYDIDTDAVGQVFGIAGPLAAEIMHENDEFSVWLPAEGRFAASPEGRWRYMREWVVSHLRDDYSSPERSRSAAE